MAPNDLPPADTDDAVDVASSADTSDAVTDEDGNAIDVEADLHDDGKPLTGPIAWMTRNSVAANLLMFIVLFGGALGVLGTKQEVFPEFDLDLVTVSVPYPGASPAEVEQGIVLVVEEAVRAVDGVKRVNSVARESVGTVSIELLLGANPDRALNDIKSAVDRISSFPEEAESPTVALASRRREVMELVVAGDAPLHILHGLAERVRGDLLDRDGITNVELEGVPPLEVAIEVPKKTAEAYNLPPHLISQQIRQSSLERPSGELETASGELLVRVSSRKRSEHDFENIILQSTAKGAQVKLGDVATIRDGYQDIDQKNQYNGQNAVRVVVYRTGDETPTSVSDLTKDYLDELKPSLPAGVVVEILNDDSEALRGRIDLLLSNAWMGLILVLIILALFLDIRLAAWVALGIPISFLGAFFLLPNFGMSVNMVTLFAFIVTLGMVVDDAIIVGEHAFHMIESGVERERAAIIATKQMSVPVTFAVLTSITAFSPLLMVPGTMGKIFKLIPLVVISVLIFSVVESFFILPAHVAHISDKKPGLMRKPFDWMRNNVAVGFEWFSQRVYRPFVRGAIRWRYATLGAALASLIVTFGAVGAGKVPFNFFPKLEGNRINATVRLPYGAPESLTLDAAKKLELGAMTALDSFGGVKVSRGLMTLMGASRGQSGETGSHVVTVTMNLIPSEDRDFTSREFETVWQENVPAILGAQSVTFKSSFGPGAGAAVDVQLTHRDTRVLEEVSTRLAEELRNYSELKDIENSFTAGKPQLDFELLPQARSLGLTEDAIAAQLRGAFFGAEALREQRGRNEVRVMVRLTDDERASEYDIEDLRIRTAQGAFVPLGTVARFSRGTSPTSIKREDGKRSVNVTAELKAGVASSRPVIESLKADVLPQLRQAYPDLHMEFVGSRRSQGEAFASLGKNFIFALFVIYALLAIPFRSYLQPLVVMFAIPLGIVGAVLGHMLMGYALSLISIFGIIALSGVVVNDSLVLIDATNGFRQKMHMGPMDAVVEGGARRLRPIILTSLTTFFGLMPMIFETSVQARFLIPMAISLGFGVLLATVVALVVVPCLYMVVEHDLRVVARELREIFKAVKHVFIPLSTSTWTVLGLIAAGVLSVGLLGGCVDPDAPAKCEVIGDDYCAQLAELCPDTDEQACKDTFDEEVVCADAVGVSDRYAVCLGSIASLKTCPLDLPSACAGAVYFVPDAE